MPIWKFTTKMKRNCNGVFIEKRDDSGCCDTHNVKSSQQSTGSRSNRSRIYV